jgi:hypothetical protein
LSNRARASALSSPLLQPLSEATATAATSTGNIKRIRMNDLRVSTKHI